MVQQSPSCVAMALALKDVQTDEIMVAELGLASDGASIMAPFLGDQKLILDLTPLEDPLVANHSCKPGSPSTP